MSKQFQAIIPFLPYSPGEELSNRMEGTREQEGSMAYTSWHKNTNFVTGSCYEHACDCTYNSAVYTPHRAKANMFLSCTMGSRDKTLHNLNLSTKQESLVSSTGRFIPECPLDRGPE
jgi:hypothetical protein